MESVNLSKENLIRLQLQAIGEDVNREGVLETPSRVVKMWDEIFSGYKQCPKDVFKTFENPSKEGQNQIVLLRDIEIFSMCEHHMLPFFGKAHIAYLPKNRVVGISKLARLADIFSKRLQIQERIGEQITDALMEYLEPEGAACVIEAKHLCMVMRGVEKQNSIMVTSSLKGVFLEASVKQELFKLIEMGR